MFLIPMGLGTITFNDRDSAETYIRNAYDSFNVSMVLNPLITADYDTVTIKNGEILTYRTVCWKQDITINRQRYTMDNIKELSQTANYLFSENGICITPETLGITENLNILMYIQGEEMQTALSTILKTLIFENEPTAFIPNYDPDIRVNRDLNNSLVGVTPGGGLG